MARALLATLLIVVLACGAAADMARPPARRLMRSGPILSDSSAKVSSASASGNSASATDSRSLSSSSASNGQVSASASLSWNFDRNKDGTPDFLQGNPGSLFPTWTSG